jgi:acylphosphatase
MMDANKPMVPACQHVVYHGRVQGVGFRLTTAQIARRYAVDGYVRNMPEGTVEIVVRCEPSVLEKFLKAVENTFEGHIDHRDLREATSNECFEIETLSGFEIRY